MEQASRLAPLRFGAFEIEPAERRLIVDGRPATVGHRAFDLLVVLAERAGKLVTKNEILDLVWPNLVVEENNLQVQVSALRKILGPDVIRTVPGHGYRLAVAPVAHAPQRSSPTPVLGNLPQALSSFVGRERELASIGELRARSRLVTLTGFGGMGKTRLALEASGVDAPADGAWFVDVGSLTDGSLLEQSVASVLGVKAAPDGNGRDALLRHVANRRILILLDGCERFVRDCARLVAELLRAGPGVSIIATSRSSLAVPGEAILQVPPLPAPASGERFPLEVLGKYEAIRLFVERARLAQRGFELREDNAAAVADVCRATDAIPLAIELAAARLRALSVAKLAERISDRFRMLSGNDPSASAHHRTLRALMDWSYELLTDVEGAFFRRLAVFPGTFTLEAAESVGSGGQIAGGDVLDLLTELVDKSIVGVEAMGERYRMLDTVREYAQERFALSVDYHDARARHLAFYLALAQRARPELFRPQQGAWLAKLDLELHNLLAAHACCDVAEGGGAAGLRLAYAIKPYWFRSGQLSLGQRIAMEALARPGAVGRDLARCRVLFDTGQLVSFSGRDEDAIPYLEEALAIAREIADRERASAVLRMLGIAHVNLRRPHSARQYFQQALGLARELNDPYRISDAVGSMANLERQQGNLEVAQSLFREDLHLSRERGDLDAAGLNLANLALVAAGRGARADSYDLLLQALAIARQSGSRWLGHSVVAFCSGLAALAEDWAAAARMYGAALAQGERMGVNQDPATDSSLGPLVGRTRATLGATAFAAAEAAGRALSYDDGLSEVGAWLATRAAAGSAAQESLTDRL